MPAEAEPPAPPVQPQQTSPPASGPPDGTAHLAPGHRKLTGGHPADRLTSLVRAGFIEYDRVVFFSDAVFAIAITLLAVNLHVRGGGISTGEELARSEHSLIGFAISFTAIGLFWIGHHSIFRYITALDRTLIVLNLLFLGTVAFLPFPTEVLSKTSSNHGIAVVFYALCCAAAGIAQGAIWIYAAYGSAGLTDPSALPVRRRFTLRIARVTVIFLASIPVAIADPRAAPFVWLLIPVSGLVINRFAGTRRGRLSDAGRFSGGSG
jgi:uncharacterized membrane protein